MQTPASEGLAEWLPTQSFLAITCSVRLKRTAAAPTVVKPTHIICLAGGNEQYRSTLLEVDKSVQIRVRLAHSRRIASPTSADLKRRARMYLYNYFGNKPTSRPLCTDYSSFGERDVDV